MYEPPPFPKCDCSFPKIHEIFKVGSDNDNIKTFSPTYKEVGEVRVEKAGNFFGL